MTMTEAPVAGRAEKASPGKEFGRALEDALGALAENLERKASGLAGKLESVGDKKPVKDAIVHVADQGLDAVAESGGVAQAAGAEGIKAHLHGRSPIWAAIRGVWEAGSPAARAWVVTGAVGGVVLLLLSPALLLVYLLSWLVLAAVQQAQHRVETTRKRRPATA